MNGAHSLLNQMRVLFSHCKFTTEFTNERGFPCTFSSELMKSNINIIWIAKNHMLSLRPCFIFFDENTLNMHLKHKREQETEPKIEIKWYTIGELKTENTQPINIRWS